MKTTVALLAVLLSACATLPTEKAVLVSKDTEKPEPSVTLKYDDGHAYDFRRVSELDFNAEVSAGSAYIVAQWVSEHQKFDALVMVIDSPGGSVYYGREISKALESSGVTVYCVVDGMAASATMALLQSCNHRLMTRRSTLMLHKPSTTLDGFVGSRELLSMLSRMEAMEQALGEQYCSRFRISIKACEDKYANGEWFLSWQEALSVGAVDGVTALPGAVLESLRARGTLPDPGLNIGVDELKGVGQ